jgi:hypothetical protein
MRARGRRFSVLAMILMVAAGAAGLDEIPLAELHRRADAAPVGDRPALYMEIAERQLKAADDLYRGGNVADAQNALKDLVSCSQKAHDAAIESGKRVKPTEIALRKMSARLHDIKETLNYEDQPPVQTAAERLRNLSDDLLAHMFGKGK